ncbi:MAG: DeoR family transcriptional regulator [Blautia sp.]
MSTIFIPIKMIPANLANISIKIAQTLPETLELIFCEPSLNRILKKERRHGNIMSDEFTPYPKNPLIQQFFANNGRTDAIGFGVRNLYKYAPIYSDGGKPELIEGDVFKITIPLDKVVAEEGREQKSLSEREQKIYNMICENLHLSVEQVMAELDISRATVFRDYAKIKKVTGAMYDKKTSTWSLD